MNKKDSKELAMKESSSLATNETFGLTIPEKVVFDDPTTGEIFGGSFPVIPLEIGEEMYPLQYLRKSACQFPADNPSDAPRMETVFLFRNIKGETYASPVVASMSRSAKEANLIQGDIVCIKRFNNTKLKRGAGAGREIAVYGLKVVVRAASMLNPAPGTDGSDE